jgi:hypothetical protein
LKLCAVEAFHELQRLGFVVEVEQTPCGIADWLT